LPSVNVLALSTISVSTFSSRSSSSALRTKNPSPTPRPSPPVDIAVSTTLAYSAIVNLIFVSLLVVHRQVDYRVFGIMLHGGIPGVVLALIAFKHVTSHGPEGALTLALGLIIFFIAAWHPCDVSNPPESPAPRQSALNGLPSSCFPSVRRSASPPPVPEHSAP
jgi:uncharacterized membrane protein YfcA